MNKFCPSTCTQIYADICIQWAKICILSQSLGSSNLHTIIFNSQDQYVRCYPASAVCYPINSQVKSPPLPSAKIQGENMHG